MRVLDLCNVIAGPTIGGLLARLGADVLKVDPPRPTYAPDVSVFYGLPANAGKRSVLLDVYDPGGRRALEALLRAADLLLVNCTRACLRRARLTARDVRAVNPRLVLAHFDAWSGPLSGGGALADSVGYDDCVQAAIGIMARFGGGADVAHAEEHAHVGTIDVVAGVAGAAAAVAALRARDRGGTLVTARASLAAVGQALQLPHAFGSPRPHWGEGEACRGESTLHRCYACADAWLLLCASFAPDDAAATARVCAALGVPRLDDGALRARPAAEASAALRAAGVAAVRLRTLVQLRAACTRRGPALLAPDAPTFQFVVDEAHPVGPLVMAAGAAVRVRGVLPAPAPAPQYGQHTHAALEAAVGPREAAALLGRGAAAARWSRGYVPYAPACCHCGERAPRAALLACGHALCAACAAAPACGACGQAIARDFRAVVAAHRAGYARWRTGGAKGARDPAREARRGRPRRRSA